MTQNAIDKYEDLLKEGYSEEDAYQNVIQSIGDVTELFEEVEERNLLELPEKDRKKRAMLKAIAVGLYIFAGVVFFACGAIEEMTRFNQFDQMDYDAVGLVLAGLICIAPTIMMVYASNMYPGYSKKKDESMVEEYKYEKYLSNRDKAVMRAVSSIVWTAALVIYFLVSFITYDWYITWVIFLIAACVQSVIALIFSLRKDKRSR